MDYKKTFRYSTGNPIVDEVGTMNFTGNVIPMVWFKTIRYPSGAPNNNAIHILADIVYWYRPKEERDEESGQLICMKKSFVMITYSVAMIRWQTLLDYQRSRQQKR